MKVFKYPFVVTDEQYLKMPRGAELLHVEDQDTQIAGLLCLWARVDPYAETVERLIIVRGTGHEVGQEPHVGTVLTKGGMLVWHVFDGGEREEDALDLEREAEEMNEVLRTTGYPLEV